MTNLLTPQEAASVLGFTVKRLYDYVQKGKVAHVRLGRSLRFHPESIEALIRDCTHNPVKVWR